MFKPKLSSQSGKRAVVPIRRVVRQGDRFTCGVCRKVHEQEQAAEQCLARCLNGYLNAATTVKAEETASGKRYRCFFCKRIYFAIEEARSCAAACRSQSEAAISAEATIDAPPQARQATKQGGAPTKQTGATTGTIPTTAAKPTVKKKHSQIRIGQNHKYWRDGRTLVCRKCGLEFQKLDAVIACYDAHPVKEKKAKSSKPKEQSAAAVNRPIKSRAKAPQPPARAVSLVQDSKRGAPVEQEPAKAAAKVAVANEDHKFSREGAKYVCRVCKKKFFTRIDVSGCYDSHAA